MKRTAPISTTAIPSFSEESGARERIISGARQHFFAHGFRGVTMDDLARELGMSKKTLYAHFTSKLVLLEAVMVDKLSRVEADLKRIAEEGTGDFPSRLRDLLSCMKTHTDEISQAYVRDIRREAPELFLMVQTRRRDFIQRYFGQLLQEGRKSGGIRKDISVRFMVEMLMGAVDAVVNPTKMEELEMVPKTALTQIIGIFLEGVIVRSEEKS